MSAKYAGIVQEIEPAGAGARRLCRFGSNGIRSMQLRSTFVFIREDGSESRVDLAGSAAAVRSRAEYLRQQVPSGGAIGLMLPSGPDLVLDWLAALVAGLRPLVMQYPTAKQARNYWASSIRNTIESVEIAAVISDAYSRDLGLAELVRTIPDTDLSALPASSLDGPIDLGRFEILQLSSGTTGFRKGITLGSDVLRQHAQDYNRALDMRPGEDRIASWLPLYHDMGFICCFVVPMYLGIDVVMMDPMTWIRRPEMLFDAIERHRATTCWMPNFAYEMLSRGAVRPLPTMRRWICGGEPISAGSARRFCDAMGADTSLFWPLYGMAENVVALTTRSGIRTRELDGKEIVSCGPPIPGVEIKTVEGEIHVRADTAIDGYMDGRRIKDADGFYATGDMGSFIDGELYVNGRRQDILIQGGRKFLLSDVDLRINELLPEVRGRAVALAIRDERVGTETLTALIESQDFIVREDRGRVEEALRANCGIDQLSVAFVPPRFLTKTSSGKFNRKASGNDWVSRSKARESDGKGDDLVALLDHYRDAPRDTRLKDVFDSLSLAVLRSVMRDAQLRYDPEETLDQVEQRIRSARPKDRDEKKPDTIRIVSLAERMIYNRLRPQHFDALARAVGRPVEFEHVCVPPAAILLSDLIFQDYFASRLEPGVFSALGRVLDKVRGASVVLTDDVAEMLWPGEQTYGVLSHSLERDPRTDRISFRWQAYARQHDRLPLTLVSGIDIPLDQSSKTLNRLSHYLGVPVFRMANLKGFAAFTADWEYRPFAPHPYQGMDPDALVSALARFILDPPRPVVPRVAQGTSLFEQSEPPHYCTTLLDQRAVDDLVNRFDRFCIAGPPASAPYVRQAIERKGKRFSQIMSFAPEVLANLREPFDCMLMLGAIGPFRIDPQMRVAALQHIGRTWRTQQLDHLDLPDVPEIPPSNADWFAPFDLDRGRNDIYFSVRRDLNEASARLRAASPWMPGREKAVPACVPIDAQPDASAVPAPAGGAELREATGRLWSHAQKGEWEEMSRLAATVRDRFPADPVGYVKGAFALRNLRRYDEADALLVDALTLFPNDPQPIIEAARTAQARGDWRAVAQRSRRLIERFPGQLAGYLMQCHAHRCLREWDDAERVHTEGARRFPDEVGIHVEGCWVAIGRENWDLALQRCAAQRDAHPTVESGYQTALVVLKRLRRYDDARSILADAEARFGPIAWIRAEILRLARQQQRPEQAIDSALNFVRTDPDEPLGYETGAWALRNLGRLDEAERLLQQAIERVAPSAQVWIEYASTAQDRGDWASVDERWSHARRLFPDDRSIGLWYARSPVLPGKPIAAADIWLSDQRYGQLHEQFPDYGSAYADHIQMFRNANCPAEAEAVARIACARLPDDLQIRIEYSQAAAARGDAATALSRLVEVKDRFFEQVVYQCRLVAALAAAGQYDDAETLCSGLIERHGDLELPRIEFAEIAMKRQDWRTAVARWRTANRMFPGNARIQKSLFDAEYASIEVDDFGHERIPVEQAPPETLSDGQLPMREIVARFESLAGTFQGCEFGAVQRYFGIEPLGLFRWGQIDVDDVIRAIEDRLEGLGSPDQTELRVSDIEGGLHNASNAEYVLGDIRYRLKSHTFIRASEMPFDKMLAQSLRRLQFLKRKFFEDLAEAQKIFVFKRGHAPIEQEQALRLSRALCAISPDAQLLCVHLASRGIQPGTVERVTPHLMYGYVSHFTLTPGRKETTRRPAYGEWASICRRAHALWRGVEVTAA